MSALKTAIHGFLGRCTPEQLHEKIQDIQAKMDLGSPRDRENSTKLIRWIKEELASRDEEVIDHDDLYFEAHNGRTEICSVHKTPFVLSCPKCEQELNLT